jgi:hypothetical protein
MNNPQATIDVCDAFKVVRRVEKYGRAPDEYWSCYRADDLTVRYFPGKVAVPRVGLLAAFFESEDARRFAEERSGDFVVFDGRAFGVSEAPDTACMASWPHWRGEAEVRDWWKDWFKDPMQILENKTEWSPDNLDAGSLWCARFEVGRWAWGRKWDRDRGLVEYGQGEVTA